MNTRERFSRIINFEKTDRTLCWEMGYWAGTVRRWYKEGLPCIQSIPDSLPDGSTVMGENITIDPQTKAPIDACGRDKDLNRYFSLDEPIWRLPLNNYLCPLYDEEMLEDHGYWVLHRSKYGVTIKDQKDHAGFPNWVSTPVNSRDDWE